MAAPPISLVRVCTRGSGHHRLELPLCDRKKKCDLVRSKEQCIDIHPFVTEQARCHFWCRWCRWGGGGAKEFAAHGATVFLSGRTRNTVEQVAAEIHQDGGVAYAAQVDALDEQAVNAYLDCVAQEGGSIDTNSPSVVQ